MSLGLVRSGAGHLGHAVKGGQLHVTPPANFGSGRREGDSPPLRPRGPGWHVDRARKTFARGLRGRGGAAL